VVLLGVGPGQCGLASYVLLFLFCLIYSTFQQNAVPSSFFLKLSFWRGGWCLFVGSFSSISRKWSLDPLPRLKSLLLLSLTVDPWIFGGEALSAKN